MIRHFTEAEKSEMQFEYDRKPHKPPLTLGSIAEILHMNEADLISILKDFDDKELDE